MPQSWLSRFKRTSWVVSNWWNTNWNIHSDSWTKEPLYLNAFREVGSANMSDLLNMTISFVEGIKSTTMLLMQSYWLINLLNNFVCNHRTFLVRQNPCHLRWCQQSQLSPNTIAFQRFPEKLKDLDNNKQAFVKLRFSVCLEIKLPCVLPSMSFNHWAGRLVCVIPLNQQLITTASWRDVHQVCTRSLPQSGHHPL